MTTCVSLDSFSNLVSLKFVTLQKVKIEGCVNMRLTSSNILCSYIIMNLVSHFVYVALGAAS